ncbi:MAG: hypothetical protein PHQ12_07470 [Chthoniobacteraceae bacterium]|nr:hypothetical protein [Chthoniobacteraceae bacterium]
MNARFWVFENGDWVKLTLRPGQALSRSQSHPTDEGWRFRGMTWRLEGDTVYQFTTCRETDCDGLGEFEQDDVCPVDQLKAKPMDADETPGGPFIFRPAWTLAASQSRDHTAEAAGY